MQKPSVCTQKPAQHLLQHKTSRQEDSRISGVKSESYQETKNQDVD